MLRKYVHGPGADEPLVWYEGAGTVAKGWLYADQMGSIVAVANSAGASTATYRYGPYGEPDTFAGAMRFRYTGQQLIGELGLYHYKARAYSPALGRFLQTDPIGYADDMNLYAYVGNNPGNATDPAGLDTQITIGYTRTVIPGAYHQVVILTDTVTGQQYATRAGPASQGLNDFIANGFGQVLAQAGVYSPLFKDTPSSVVAKQEVGTVPTDYSQSVANAIEFAYVTNNNATPYSPFGPNSNSYASTFVQSLTGTRPTPDMIAPGSQMGMSSSKLSYSPSQLQSSGSAPSIDGGVKK